MHDIDRTLADLGSEMEFEDDYETDFGDEEYEPDMELEYDDGEFEYADEYYAGEYETEYDEGEGVFDEEEEYDLASELLATTDDEELEMFLGKLISRARKKLRKVVKSPVGRILRKALRGVAKRALPIAGRAVGTAFGGPVGGAFGSRIAKAGGRIFGLELEGLSGEDQEFEVARRVVRLAGAATKNAATVPSSGNPVKDAKKALAKAAKVHAPGLLTPNFPTGALATAGGVSGRSGRWWRRGRKIILTGV